MEYNAALRECPNCGTRRPRAFRWMFTSPWPLALAIGFAVQILSQRLGPEGGRAGQPRLSDVASVSQFIAGMLVFSALAALLLFIVSLVWTGLRRRIHRRHRRRDARRRSH